MSLGVAVKGPEGIVLAADSRVTLQAQTSGGPLPLYYDNATKLMSFSQNSENADKHRHVGIVTYGAAVIGMRTAHSFLPEFESECLQDDRMKIREYAERIRDFYLRQWRSAYDGEGDSTPPMTFIVAGFDAGEAYGRTFLFAIPSVPDITEQNSGENFGMTWGGQLEVASRLVHGYDPRLPAMLASRLGKETAEVVAAFQDIRPDLEYSIPYAALPLQDCVDLAKLMIQTTADAQRLYVGVRGVGGMVEVATVTRKDGFRFIRKKDIQA